MNNELTPNAVDLSGNILEAMSDKPETSAYQYLIDRLEKLKTLPATTPQYKKELWYEHTPEKLVAKIMHENATNFYKKFFV